MGDTKYTVNESSLKGEKTQLVTNEEPLMAVLQKDTINDVAANTCEIHSASKEKVEPPKLEDGEIVGHHMTKCTDGEGINAGGISPQEELLVQLTYLQTEEGIHKHACQAQKLKLSETSNMVRVQAEESNSGCSGDKRLEDKTVFKATECWDDYVILSGDVNSNAAGNEGVLLNPLLFNTQPHLDVGVQLDAQTSWHFPAAPGLTQEVQCPLWHFPVASYYPQLELTTPFEVVWREWDECNQKDQSSLIPFSVKKMSMDFTVMSYNILAQDLLEANKQLYVQCPLEVLDWTYRCSLLLKEIENWTPDILCLQEVQENHYHEQLYPALSQMGYTCVYKRRTGTKTDGCATCYRSTCFAEVAVTKLEFFRPELEMLDRHNVGIVLLIRPLIVQEAVVTAVGPPLCVANTHLLFNPKKGDVKLAQLAILLAEIDAVVKSCKAKGEHCNVVVCGDFNSVPHMPLHQLIITGELYYQGLPANMISGQEDQSNKHCYRHLRAPLWPNSLGINDLCQYTANTNNHTSESTSQKSEKRQYTREFILQFRYCPAACVRPQDLILIPGVTNINPENSRDDQQQDKRFRHILRHMLDLESVYKHFLPRSGCPEITTLHAEGGNTVDYIFYSPKRDFAPDQKAYGKSAGEGLKLTGFLSLLSEDVLWSMNGLPNHIFPSDHLSLLARFQLDINAE
nr:protein angel homolog 1 [Nothobranchius furzeri]